MLRRIIRLRQHSVNYSSHHRIFLISFITMHRAIYRFILLFCLTFFIFSCGKDIVEFKPWEGKKVNAGLMIQVTDSEGNPLPSATVYHNKIRYTTNINGLVSIDVASLSTVENTLIIRKPGYFENNTCFNVVTGSIVSLHCILYKVAEYYTIDANSGATLETPGGLRLHIPAQALFQAQALSPYNGAAKVSLRYIDPASDNFFSQLPAMLRGLSETGSPVLLSSYGVLQIEITDLHGNKLELGSEKFAQISAPVSPLFGGFSSSVWYFDVNTGLWNLDGTVSKQSDRFSADLSHFGFLNFGNGSKAVFLSGRLVDVVGRPFSFLSASFTGGAEDGIGYCFTDSDGSFGAFVAADARIKMSVKAPCGEEIYATDLETNNSNLVIGDLPITVSKPGISLLYVNAQLTNCDNQPISGGLAKWSESPIYYPADKGGNIRLIIPICSSTGLGNLYFMDPLAAKKTDEVSMAYPSEQELGRVQVCQSINDYVWVNAPALDIKGIYLYSELDLYYDEVNKHKNLFAYTAKDQLRLNIALKWADIIPDFNPGSYNLIDSKVYGSNPQNLDGIINEGKINIITGGKSGEIIEGTFEGKVKLNNSPDSFPLNGRFRMKGQ